MEALLDQSPVNHPALLPLFDPDIPNRPALWAVLQGRHDGRVVVDDIQHPSQCLLRTDAALTYPSRHIDQGFLDAAVTHFRKKGPVWLVCPPEMTFDLPTNQDAQVCNRLAFEVLEPFSDTLARWRERKPAEFVVRTIDRSTLERCEWRDEMIFYCGSLENFLTHGIGFCLWHGDEIIVEAYASALGGGKAEIGAITRQAHRGKGYAPIACAYLIDACQQRGYQAYWSCDADNPASVSVARKLGFQREYAYTIYEF